jgi:alkaline phosphatase
VNKNGPRLPAVNISAAADYYVNPKDNPNGILYNGTESVDEPQGVHSLTDVPVFAQGPCQAAFGGVYSATDIFYRIAECFGLSGKTDTGYSY